MQSHQMVSDLRKLVGPGTRQEQVPPGEASPSLLSTYVYGHAPTLATSRGPCADVFPENLTPEGR
jgi:hypothetical protein